MGKKNKLQRFAENLTFSNLFQYRYEEVVKGFSLRGKWKTDFFHNNHPLILELGCGKGEYTVEMARRNPEINYIGIDIKGARMWRGLKTAQEENLKNVAFVRTRIELSEYYFGEKEVDGLWITFPDPQIKAKRERKRLTSPRFLERYAKFLTPDAVIRLKTDALLLYDYTREVIEKGNHILLEANEDIYHSGIDNEITQIQTFYEKKWLEHGTPIRYLAFRLNPEWFEKKESKQ
ncbi:tRNA (guanosine(46)-N7)-methyltransferase TrmB [Candidatus Sulfidibacterium hydrothermale]|uniref:tRNA (guanosine(46)-N7)-methyltransferase TrmB n=1 Tax=Candidatus Sulfidibacterium hydrothermale TaxID=2875962 RepID=UPI001F0A122B|nr:tRNA (guanosine(46)-N7)-methyltransferase TrmB [Candidatus Sulfidibacterium hydrothermale]UBM61846.1 tRNA (guanosine(46)-N7)-methyltransferase TrmB [Candidatus Sulfidibacterium hydrothermale]